MASRKYSITEPHPSVPKSGNAYLSGGRGGAGNFKRYKAEDLTSGPSATGPASRVSLSKPFKKSTYIPAGRGGSGNMCRPNDNEERVFQFDEEMVKRSEAKAPVYHIGRGGAANWEREEGSSERQRHGSIASSDSAASENSTGSNVRGALNKLTRKFS